MRPGSDSRCGRSGKVRFSSKNEGTAENQDVRFGRSETVWFPSKKERIEQTEDVRSGRLSKKSDIYTFTWGLRAVCACNTAMVDIHGYQRQLDQTIGNIKKSDLINEANREV